MTLSILALRFTNVVIAYLTPVVAAGDIIPCRTRFTPNQPRKGYMNRSGQYEITFIIVPGEIYNKQVQVQKYDVNQAGLALRKVLN